MTDTGWSSDSNNVIFQRRIRLFRLVIVAISAIFVARLFSIQILEHGKYAKMSAMQSDGTFTVHAFDGTLRDRNGIDLEVNYLGNSIYSDNFQVTHPEQYAEALSPLLGMPVSTIARSLERRSGSNLLSLNAPPHAARVIDQYFLPGISVEQVPLFEEPFSSETLQILGSVYGPHGEPTGYQQLLENTVSDANGKVHAVVSPSGQIEHLLSRESPIEGTAIRTTLDLGLMTASQKLWSNQLDASIFGLERGAPSWELLGYQGAASMKFNPLGCASGPSENTGANFPGPFVNAVAFLSTIEGASSTSPLLLRLAWPPSAELRSAQDLNGSFGQLVCTGSHHAYVPVSPGGKPSICVGGQEYLESSVLASITEPTTEAVEFTGNVNTQYSQLMLVLDGTPGSVASLASLPC
jgi:hypothetical protein